MISEYKEPKDKNLQLLNPTKTMSTLERIVYLAPCPYVLCSSRIHLKSDPFHTNSEDASCNYDWHFRIYADQPGQKGRRLLLTVIV